MGSGRFAIVPARAVEDQRLGNAALRVLCCLGTYSDKDGWCWPGVKTLADRIGVRRQAVQQALKELVDIGYIEKKPQRRKDRGDTANRYRLLFDRALFALRDRSADEGALPVQAGLAGGQAELAGGVQAGLGGGCKLGLAPIKNVPNRTTLSRSIDIDPAAATQFEEFWSLYPHRPADPKKPARQLFAAAVKRGVDPAVLIRGAENYAASVRADGTERQFIAQAQTWLRQERWNEYQEASRRSGTGSFSYGHNT